VFEDCAEPKESRVVSKFEKWNYADMEELVQDNRKYRVREEVFNKTTENFTFLSFMKKQWRVVLRLTSCRRTKTESFIPNLIQ
jgi:hypothetical protein